MLWIVILEVLVVAGVAIAVLKDEKKSTADFAEWSGSGKKIATVYRVPLHLIVREEIKAVVEQAVQKGPRHRYVQP
jgi:hypothetical protein